MFQGVQPFAGSVRSISLPPDVKAADLYGCRANRRSSIWSVLGRPLTGKVIWPPHRSPPPHRHRPPPCKSTDQPIEACPQRTNDSGLSCKMAARSREILPYSTVKQADVGRTENPRVGGSIPPLRTRVSKVILVGCPADIFVRDAPRSLVCPGLRTNTEQARPPAPRSAWTWPPAPRAGATTRRKCWPWVCYNRPTTLVVRLDRARF